MINFINKIQNLSLEDINKNLIFIAILSLLFRVGNFSTNYIPKPFELIVVLIWILTCIDLIKNKKIREFYFSITKKVRIALILLVSSVMFGWVIGTAKGTPINFNMVLEFGSFIFALSIFVLILFYTRNDKKYLKLYFYALLLPVVYIFCIIFPSIARYLNLLELNAKFIGFTNNTNIISKILLIPTIFFIIKSLLESKRYLKILYISISSLLVSLLLWTASRGAILSLFISIIFLFLILRKLNWKFIISSILIVLSIFSLGFILAPKIAKDMVLNRALGTIDSRYYVYENVNDLKRSNEEIKPISWYKKVSSELRFKIWRFYLNKTLVNPFGYGPDTHMKSYILRNDGQYDNDGPHNSYLQIWLWGGVVSLLFFLYIIYLVYLNLVTQIKSNIDITIFILITVLFSLSVSIFFDDSLQFFYYWIILAIGLNYKHVSQN